MNELSAQRTARSFALGACFLVLVVACSSSPDRDALGKRSSALDPDPGGGAGGGGGGGGGGVPACGVDNTQKPPMVTLPPPGVFGVGMAMGKWVEDRCPKIFPPDGYATPRDITCTFKTSVSGAKATGVSFSTNDCGNSRTQWISGKCEYFDTDGKSVGSRDINPDKPPTEDRCQTLLCSLTCEGTLKGTVATSEVTGQSFAGDGVLPDGFCKEFQTKVLAAGLDCSVGGATGKWNARLPDGTAPWIGGEEMEHKYDFNFLTDEEKKLFPTAVRQTCIVKERKWTLDETKAKAICSGIADGLPDKDAACGNGFRSDAFQTVVPAAVCLPNKKPDATPLPAE